MAPIGHGLEDEYFNRFDFVYLDIDDPANADFLKQLGFRYQPHFLLIDGQGKIIQQWLGPVAAEDFRAAFNPLLQ